MDQNESGKRCLRVGITGGIGSGKTTACRIFVALGVPVYDADFWAKWLIVNAPGIKSAIVSLFGPEAYCPDGSYNRTYVAAIVFKDAAKLALLNAAVHPAVEQHSRDWHQRQADAGRPYTLKEAALLVENGSYRHLDKLIVVTAPEQLRIQRVMQRDGLSEAAVRARMRQQLPQEQKDAAADYLIHNDGRSSLVQQVWHIHQKLVALAYSDF